MRIKNRSVFVTDPPPVTAENFRDYVANDKLFMDYFNTFLSLPIFPVAYQFCYNEGLYRLATELDADPPRPNEPQRVRRMNHISARRHSFQTIPLLPMETMKKNKIESKPQISTLILNRRKGLQWLLSERLFPFLQSRLYAEYRLARILSQSRLIRHDFMKVPDLYLIFVPLKEPAHVEISPDEDDEDDLPSESKTDAMVLSFGDMSQSEIDLWNENAKLLNEVGFETDLGIADISLSEILEESGIPANIACIIFANMDLLSPEIGPAAYVVPCMEPKDAPTRRSSALEDTKKEPRDPLHANNLEELSMMLIAAVMKSALVEVEEVSQEEVEESIIFKELFPFSDERKSHITLDDFIIPVIFDEPEKEESETLVLRDLSGYHALSTKNESLFLSLDPPRDHFSFPAMNYQKEKQFSDYGMGLEDLKEMYPTYPDEQDVRSKYSFSSNTNIREFRALLKEKSCEKNWFLWIDLEKFRQCKTEDNRELSILAIKNKYYNTIPLFELSTELKNELDINNWQTTLTDLKVTTIQKILLEPFIQYWMPLYLLKKQIQSDPTKYRSYFKLKKARINFTKFSAPEVDTDVSIFVLRPSKDEKKAAALEMQQKDNSLDVLQLPSDFPIVGNRRTYLISALKQDYIAKQWRWPETDSKRHSISVTQMKMEKENKIEQILCDYEDYFKPFTMRRPSNSTDPQEIWPNSRVNIELVDRKFPDGNRSLPKELSCLEILRGNRQMSAPQPSLNEEDEMEEREYKLLSTLFSALKCERASGEIFALYCRDKNFEVQSYCLMLWDAISKFLCLFYHQPVVWARVIRQVKLIHAEFLTESARLTVKCNPDITHEVKKNLNDPTGDMFKNVAEHILAILLPSWKKYRYEEKQKAMELLTISE